jgi:lipopolysaccharide biosynthesis regulator YciM
MISNLCLLFLPAAAASGWYYGRRKARAFKPTYNLPRDYFIGLNYLLNEQTDKAVDVFIKMLDVNSDTLETHLALGSLFRRRGEVDRAIRVHQNLLARPQLARQQKMAALFELAQDYFRAGVLDRAEKLFLELIEANEKAMLSLQFLLRIYQQQKDWEQAINTVQRLEVITKNSMKPVIAQYYCELAKQHHEKHQQEHALRLLKQALTMDPNCVRASILQAEIETALSNWQAAIKSYQQVKKQDAEFLSEVIVPLSQCYNQLHNELGFIKFLQKCLTEHPPTISVVLVLGDYLRRTQGDKTAIDFIAEQIHRQPSLRGLEHLIELYLQNSQGDTRNKLGLLHDLVQGLLADKPHYHCLSCGFTSKSLFWQCPRCYQWGSIKPIHGIEGD